MSMPVLFVSHGSPMLALTDGPAHRFLQTLAADLPRPKAIVVVSAHWETQHPVVGAAPVMDTIYDFFGFPPELYKLTYPAKGDPALAHRVEAALSEAGFKAASDDKRGLDHGAWVPLHLTYPNADIPVIQVSIQSHLGPEHHYRLGQALAPLRDEGVLILASGSLTHNLYAFRDTRAAGEAQPALPWVQDFAEWVASAVEGGRIDDLLHFEERAPHAHDNHPTDEHFLPLFVALGAAGHEPVKRIHASTSYGILAMDAYRAG